MLPMTEQEWARNALVERHIPLAVKVARDRHAGNLDVEERISAAYEALIKAAQHFKPHLGFRFSTYATWVIRRELVRVSLAERLMPLTTHAIAGRITEGFKARRDAVMAIRSLDAAGCDPIAPDEDDGPDWGRMEELREAIGRLPERHRQVIEGRLAGDTLEAIGGRLGVTKERVRQIDVKAKRAMRWAFGISDREARAR